MISTSSNTIAKRPRTVAPVHPGRILQEALSGERLSMNQLATATRVPANRINAIVAGRRSITGETALRLAHYFGTTPEYWLHMQTRYDLDTARDLWEARIGSEVQPRSAA